MGRQVKQGTSLNCVLLIFLVLSILLSAFAVRNAVSCCMTLPSNPSHEDFWSYLTEQPSLHVLLSHRLSHMCFSMSLTHLLLIKHFFSCLAFYRFFPAHFSVSDRFAVRLSPFHTVLYVSCITFPFIFLVLCLVLCPYLSVSSIWFNPLCSVEVNVWWKVLLKYTIDWNKEIMNWFILNANLYEYVCVFLCVDCFKVTVSVSMCTGFHFILFCCTEMAGVEPPCKPKGF